MVINGELISYDPRDYSCISKHKDKYIVESANGNDISETRKTPTTDEVIARIFRISDMEKFEQKNRISARDESIPTKRKAIVLAEARKLRLDDPDMDRVRAKRLVDVVLKKHNFQPYSRTQFDRIIDELGFLPGKRGRKPSTKKK